VQDSDPTAAAAISGLGSRAARNTVLVLGARVVSRLLALVAVLAVNSHLGPDGFGRMQTLVTYTALVATVLDLGFNTLYVREGARHLDQLERYLDNVLSVKALLSVAGLVALAGLLRVPGLEDLLAPGFALMVLSAYSNLLRGTFYANGRLGWEAIDIVLESAVLLGLFAVGIVTHQGVAYFLWAYAAGYGLSCVYFAVVISATRMARLRWRFETDFLRVWFWTGLPLAVTYVLTNVYFKIDVPILQHFRPYTEVGWYTAAYKPFEALLFLPLTIRQVVFPAMSVYFRSAPDHLRVSAEKLWRALLLAGWPATVGMFVLAPQLTRLMHLAPESEPALRILSLAIVVMFVDNTFVAALNAMDLQGLYARIAVLGLVVNVGLNAVLIPHSGYLGASWSTVLTEVVLATTGWVMLARHGRRLDLVALSWRILLAGLLMGGALVPLRDVHGFATVGVVVGGAVVYCGLLWALRTFDADELGLMRRALRPAAPEPDPDPER
jgi:O-antigen/teichoic acid export membrane protein